MSLQERIMKRQNETDMLGYQFSSRRYFNTAEKCYSMAIIFSVISLLLAIPELNNSIVVMLFIITASIFDVVSWVLLFFAGQSVKYGALLRNYFDNYVLGFKTTGYSERTIRKIKDLTNKCVKKHKKEYEIQTSHTSRDDPPGVKDWYEFSTDYSDADVVFECQRQNQWWTTKLLLRRIAIFFILLVCIIVVAIIVLHYSQIGVLKILVCFIGLVITFIDIIIESIRCVIITLEIEGSIKILEASKNLAQLELLQAMIEKRRELPVVEINLIHKRKSRVFSEEYEQLSK